MGFLLDPINTVNQANWLGYTEKVQKQLAPLNKQFYDQAAASTLDAGEQAAGRTELKGTQVIGQERVGAAASGLDVQSGSPVDAMLDTRMMSSLDAQTLRNNAAREAWGLRVRGVQAQQQGILDSQRTDNEIKGTVLTGFGKESGDILNAGKSFGGGY